MQLQRVILLAFRALWRNRRRTLAMLAGLVVGIALLAGVDSVGAASRRVTLAQVRNMLGTFDTILIRPGAAKTRGMVSLANVPPTLSFDDAAAIGALPSIAQVADLQNAFDIDVQYRDRESTPAVFGVSANWLSLRGDALARGRFFTPPEVTTEGRVAVLGRDVVVGLFGASRGGQAGVPGVPSPAERQAGGVAQPRQAPRQSIDPLGKMVRLGGQPYQVVGVLAPRGAGPGGFSLDNLVLIPLSTARHRLFNRDFLTMVVAQIRPPASSAGAMNDVRQLLRRRHHIAAAALDDFSLTDPSAVAAQLASVRSRLAVVLQGAAYACFGLGAVAILSLMLLGVSERRSEIAIRRAAGATQGAILLQFLAEAAVLGALGAALGAALAYAATEAAARWQHLPHTWAGATLAEICLAAFALALLCGLLPAVSAARLEPAAALRP